jgi:hypothetical protein
MKDKPSRYDNTAEQSSAIKLQPQLIPRDLLEKFNRLEERLHDLKVRVERLNRIHN